MTNVRKTEVMKVCEHAPPMRITKILTPKSPRSNTLERGSTSTPYVAKRWKPDWLWHEKEWRMGIIKLWRSRDKPPHPHTCMANSHITVLTLRPCPRIWDAVLRLTRWNAVQAKYEELIHGTCLKRNGAGTSWYQNRKLLAMVKTRQLHGITHHATPHSRNISRWERRCRASEGKADSVTNVRTTSRNGRT